MKFHWVIGCLLIAFGTQFLVDFAAGQLGIPEESTDYRILHTVSFIVAAAMVVWKNMK
jgi:hypothetical protein